MSLMQAARMTQAALGIPVVAAQTPPAFYSTTAPSTASVVSTSTSGVGAGEAAATAGSGEVAEDAGDEDGSDRMPGPLLGDPPDEGNSGFSNDKALTETRRRFVDERFDMVSRREKEKRTVQLAGDPHSVYGELSASEWVPLGEEGLVVASRGTTDAETIGAGSEPIPGDYIKLHLVGRLEDGTVVDSEHAPGSGNAMHVLWLTRQMVIGLEMGIQGMRVGERRTVRVPPHLGFGQRRNDAMGVPRNAVLLYDVELLAVGDEAVPPAKSIFE